MITENDSNDRDRKDLKIYQQIIKTFSNIIDDPHF